MAEREPGYDKAKFDTAKVGTGDGRKPPVWVPDLSEGKTHDLSAFVIPRHYREDLAGVIVPRGFIFDKIEKLAVDIREYYGDSELHVLCVLKGSRGFFAELLKVLNRIHRYTSHHTTPPFMEHYVRIKSYENTESTGRVQIMADDLQTLKGQDVLVIEDIIDTGGTLTKFCAQLQEFGPKSVRTASLFEKRTPKSCGFKSDFAGFSVPDVFLVGFCLDYNEVYRDLDPLCWLSPTGIDKYKSK